MTLTPGRLWGLRRLCDDAGRPECAEPTDADASFPVEYGSILR